MDTPRDDRGSEDEAIEESERSVIDDAGVNNDGDDSDLEETE